MKNWMYMTALIPAGLLAAFVGAGAARQDEAAPPPDVARRVHRVQAVPAVPGRGMTFQGPVVAAPLAPALPGTPQAMTLRTEVAGPDGFFTPQAFVMGHGPGSDQTHKAIAKLRAAKTDEEKAEARKDLKSTLDEQFDEYLDHQAKELDRLEEKLEKLRAQWEKRKEAKDELVELRLQTLENEANGLGWPAGGPGNGVWSFNLDPLAATTDFNFSVTAPAPFASPVSPATPMLITTETEEVTDVAEPEEPEEEDAAPAPRRRSRGVR